MFFSSNSNSRERDWHATWFLMSKTNESLVCPCWTNLMENMNTLFDSFFKKKNVKSIPDTLAIVGLKKALLLGMKV